MKTTKADFKRWSGYCAKWQRELGLDDWHIYYRHAKLAEAYASTATSCTSRTATITLNTSWDEYRPITPARS